MGNLRGRERLPENTDFGKLIFSVDSGGSFVDLG
jgi:hypothetical protein